MDQDLKADESSLTAGPPPVWVQCCRNSSQADRVKFVLDKVEIKQYKKVMVLHKGEGDEEAAAVCEENHLEYLNALDVCGTEALAVIMLMLIYPEWITRAANLLVMVAPRSVLHCIALFYSEYCRTDPRLTALVSLVDVVEMPGLDQEEAELPPPAALLVASTGPSATEWPFTIYGQVLAV